MPIAASLSSSACSPFDSLQAFQKASEKLQLSLSAADAAAYFSAQVRQHSSRLYAVMHAQQSPPMHIVLRNSSQAAHASATVASRRAISQRRPPSRKVRHRAAPIWTRPGWPWKRLGMRLQSCASWFKPRDAPAIVILPISLECGRRRSPSSSSPSGGG